MFLQCTPAELVRILLAFERVASVFEIGPGASRPNFKSKLLDEAAATLPSIQRTASALLGKIYQDKAKEGKMEDMFRDDDLFPQIQDCKDVSCPHSRSMETRLVYIISLSVCRSCRVRS